MAQRAGYRSLTDIVRARRRPTPETVLRAGVIACVSLALLLAIVTRTLAGSPGDAQRLIGHPAPHVSLRAVQDGRLLPQPVDPAAQQGHPTLLLFTYSLCPHCLAETQAVQQLERRYAAQGVRVAYIDSPAEATGIAVAYQQRLTLSDPLLLDANGSVAGRFGIHYYPATVVIDAHGMVRRVEAGETTPQALQRDIEEVVR